MKEIHHRRRRRRQLNVKENRNKKNLIYSLLKRIILFTIYILYVYEEKEKRDGLRKLIIFYFIQTKLIYTVGMFDLKMNKNIII